MAEARKSSEDMLGEYHDNLDQAYEEEQASVIRKYSETLEENQKTIMAVVVNYMKKVFETIETEDLKIKFSSMDEDVMKMAGIDYLKGIDKTAFLWGSGRTGFSETYDEGHRINMEFFPFGKDGGVDTNKLGKHQGMSLFVLTLLKDQMQNIQSESYEPEFVKLIQRGGELGVLRQTGGGYSGEVIAQSNLNFIPDDVRETLMNGKAVKREEKESYEKYELLSKA